MKKPSLSPANLNAKADRILDVVTKTITGLKLSATVQMESARLAEHWIAETSSFDLQFETLAVEVPFFIFVDKFTVVIGVMDRLALENTEPPAMFGCEWKTSKGTTKFWNEDKWLASITKGHQVGVYALAQREGYFLWQDPVTGEPWPIPAFGNAIVADTNSPQLWQPSVKSPRLMVRAITKEHPPKIWPSEGQAFLDFSAARLQAVKNGLINKGAQIRASRATGLVPWQLPGLQCENRFSHETCQFFEGHCSQHPRLLKTGDLPLIGVTPTDPGLAARGPAESLLRVPLNDERVVVISASSYDDASNCLEHYRMSSSGTEVVVNDYQDALDKGQGLHAALAAYLRECR